MLSIVLSESCGEELLGIWIVDIDLRLDALKYIVSWNPANISFT